MIDQILIMYSPIVTACLSPILAHFFLLFGTRPFSEYPNKNKILRQKVNLTTFDNANLVIHERAYT